MNPKTGLYSKAAQLIRSLPQERGTAEQMIAAARKAGVKDVELQNAGRLPSGKITRDDLAAFFESKVPPLRIEQYGHNPSFLDRDMNQRRIALMNRANREGGLTPEEQEELEKLTTRIRAQPSVIEVDDDEGEANPIYGKYKLPGATNYRERLLKYDRPPHPAKMLERQIGSAKRQMEYEAPIYGNDPNHPKMQAHSEKIAGLQNQYDQAIADHGPVSEGGDRYQSSHWDGHPDVLAHIRLTDRTVGEDRDSVRPIAEKLAAGLGVGVRDLASGAASVGIQNGIITPQEAASLSRVMRWRNGYDQGRGVGKRLLHVEELQSDWAQEGRDKGFNDGSAMKAYRDHVEDMRGRMRQSLLDQGMREEVARPLYENAEPWHLAKFHGEEDKLNALRDAVNDQQGKVPQGPYVQNTQHWTDLALKNVLREAALGGYDGIVFTPGQAHNDRYGLEKHMDQLTYHPNGQSLMGLKNGRPVFSRDGVKPEDVASYVGKDISERLLHPDNAVDLGGGDMFHAISDDGLKMGGDGMRGYYDGIVPKSVMKLAQQHDPSIKPAEPIPLQSDDGESYQGFHLPMTDQLRQGILDKGFPAMKRGGAVDAALAATRRFTKDGAAAMMRLKS